MTNPRRSIGFNQLDSPKRPRNYPFLRFFSPETNRGVLSILALLTFLLAVFGGIYLRQSQPVNIPNLRMTHNSSLLAPSLQTVQTDATDAVAVSAGPINDFFVLKKNELLYYRLFDSQEGKLQVNKGYSIHLDEKPTASCFVMKPGSSFYKKMFIAFANSISLFDPETKIISPYVKFEAKSIITGLTTDGYELYAADAGLGIIYRVDRYGKIFTWGLADETTGFGGFLKNEYTFFDLDVAPKNETIYVTHPDKFRVEAFSALDGHWKEDESFEKRPMIGSKRGEFFSPDANPASIVILGDGSFLTTDAGPEPNVKSWYPDGSFQAEISLPEINAPIASDQAPLATITFTESRAVRLLILLPTGILVSFTGAP